MATRIRLRDDAGVFVHDMTSKDTASAAQLFDKCWTDLFSGLIRSNIEKGIGDASKTIVTVQVTFS